jgi:hypothetical protein
MIKINLASKKRASANAAALVEGGGTSGGFTLGGFTNLSGMSKFGREQLEELKDLPLKRLLLTILFYFGGSFAIDYLNEKDIEKLDIAIEGERSRQTQLNRDYDKTKLYNDLEKQLKEHETAIRVKLETIQELLNDRTTPPKLLIALSTAIPKEIWLEELKVQSTEIAIRGSSLGYNQISDFMKSLGENAFFKEVNLKSSQQVKDTSAGVEIANFELVAKRAVR